MNPFDRPPTKKEIEQQNEIAEYIFGMVAKRDGKDCDTTKSLAWQKGWAEAQGIDSSITPASPSDSRR